MFVVWILLRHVMSEGQDSSLTRCDTTTDNSCFLETHCYLWEQQQITQVVGWLPLSGRVRWQVRGNVQCVILALLQRRPPLVFPRHHMAGVTPAPLAETVLCRPATVNFDRPVE